MERRQSRSTLTKSMMAVVATLLILILVVLVSSSSAATATTTTTTTTIQTVAPNAAFVVPRPRALTRHRRATAHCHPLASVARPETSSSSPDGAPPKTVGEDESSPGDLRSVGASVSGPRVGEAGQRRRPERRRRGSTSGPRATATERRKSPSPTRKRAPHQFDHKTETAWSRTDKTAAELVATQDPNEDAPPLTWLPSTDDDGGCIRGDKIKHPHLMTVSLDDLFPDLGFSDLFATSKTFRDEIRNSMREDVFDTTPAYANMSEKARRMLLLPDSSLQGSWRCRNDDADHGDGDDGGSQIRMKELTRTLTRHLGEGAPTGDQFMEVIGSLCGSNPRTHWIDIVGLTDRVVPHSWHQDTGRQPSSREGGDSADWEGDEDSRTVLLGFPPCDEYDGTGVFSHVVKLDRERIAPEGHPPGEPVLYGGEVGDEFVVRPRFARGREIVAYRDVDVLHSAPDVAHRTSVMRFM